MIAEAGRLGTVRQALVNPSDECLWNLLSACSNTGRALTASFSERHRRCVDEARQCECSAASAYSCRPVHRVNGCAGYH
jgi:hypothetical protein